MSTKNNTPKTAEKNVFNNNQTVGTDGSIHICMRTRPEEGEANFIVKVIHPNNTVTVFWMSQKGQPLNPAKDKIWKNCLKTWKPKVPVEKLPFGMLKASEEIVEKIKYAMIHDLPVGEYVFPKNVDQVKKVKQELQNLKKENEEALRKLGIAPKVTVNKNAGSNRAGYTHVSFEDVAHAPKRKTA